MAQVQVSIDSNNQKGVKMSSRNYGAQAAKNGISFGCALAMVISYVTWKSVGWAIIHGLFSWFYVIYFVIKYNGV